MEYPQFQLQLKKFSGFDKQSRPYSVKMYVELEGQEKMEYTPHINGAELIKEYFTEALDYGPKKIYIQEFTSENPSRQTKPITETTIILSSQSSADTNAPANPYEGLAGKVGDEMLTVDAMVERIKNLNEKLSEKQEKIAELQTEINEASDDDEQEEAGLAGIFKNASIDQITQLAGIIGPLLKGNSAAPQQLSGQNEETAKLNIPVQNIVKHLQSLDENSFTKTYEVFHYMSQDPEALDEVYSLIPTEKKEDKTAGINEPGENKEEG